MDYLAKTVYRDVRIIQIAVIGLVAGLGFYYSMHDSTRNTEDKRLSFMSVFISHAFSFFTSLLLNSSFYLMGRRILGWLGLCVFISIFTDIYMLYCTINSEVFLVLTIVMIVTLLLLDITTLLLVLHILITVSMETWRDARDLKNYIWGVLNKESDIVYITCNASLAALVPLEASFLYAYTLTFASVGNSQLTGWVFMVHWFAWISLLVLYIYSPLESMKKLHAPVGWLILTVGLEFVQLIQTGSDDYIEMIIMRVILFMFSILHCGLISLYYIYSPDHTYDVHFYMSIKAHVWTAWAELWLVITYICFVDAVRHDVFVYTLPLHLLYFASAVFLMLSPKSVYVALLSILVTSLIILILEINLFLIQLSIKIEKGQRVIPELTIVTVATAASLTHLILSTLFWRPEGNPGFYVYICKCLEERYSSKVIYHGFFRRKKAEKKPVDSVNFQAGQAMIGANKLNYLVNVFIAGIMTIEIMALFMYILILLNDPLAAWDEWLELFHFFNIAGAVLCLIKKLNPRDVFVFLSVVSMINLILDIVFSIFIYHITPAGLTAIRMLFIAIDLSYTTTAFYCSIPASVYSKSNKTGMVLEYYYYLAMKSEIDYVATILQSDPGNSRVIDKQNREEKEN